MDGRDDETHQQQAIAHSLNAQSVGVQFDGLVALDEVSIQLTGQEIVGLIGPNGAGKTTLVNVLTGFQRPSSGRVLVDGVDIAGLKPQQVARKGIARTFQAARLFDDLTVLENLQVGAFACGLAEVTARERGWALMEFLSIGDVAHKQAGELSYGDSRRVGIGRALATGPKFILMDEPAAGMSEPECEDLIEVISAIPGRFDCGIILIEHNFSLVMRVSQHVHVLDSGRTLVTGNPAEIRHNTDVLSAYLGQEVLAE